MELPCPHPDCEASFFTLDGLLKHEKEMHGKPNELTQDDFHEEGRGQWVLNYNGWRFLVRQTDGNLEIVIRAKIDQDPSLEDWDKALRTLNAFIKRERIGKGRQEG